MEILSRDPELEALAKRILCGFATGEDLQAAKVEDVRAIKCDTGERHYRSVSEPLLREADAPKRAQKYIASDETVDRMGDIIRVKGWDLETFQKNPQALWSHDGRQFPIGTVSEMHKGTRNGRAALIETINYLEEGTTREADILWKLVDQGVIRAVSVGFLPIKTTWPETPEEREQLGLGPWGVLYEKQEQLELSNCTIPANPSALATKSVRAALRKMIQAGEITERDAESVVGLGAKRKIQVAVPELPEPEAPALDKEADLWAFRVGADGMLHQVKIGEPEPEAEVSPEFAALEQLNATLISRTNDLSRELDELRDQVAALPALIEAAVGRVLRTPEDDRRRALEAAVKRYGQSLAQESL